MTQPALLEFVEPDVARSAGGTRLIVAGMVPSPWSEATKGLFRVAGVPVLAVRRLRDNTEALKAWTGIDNVPVVLHENEPPRSHWAPILTLAARLSPVNPLLPERPERRAEMVGLIHELAGEGGLGWNSRLAMIDAAFKSGGDRGFPLPVAQYLAGRYGYSVEAMSGLGDRVRAQLELFGARLAACVKRREPYFMGSKPGALDVYLACFLTPFTDIDEGACPALSPRLRAAFGAAHEAFGAWVPEALWEHRKRMFEGPLEWPIRI